MFSKTYDLLNSMKTSLQSEPQYSYELCVQALVLLNFNFFVRLSQSVES